MLTFKLSALIHIDIVAVRIDFYRYFGSTRRFMSIYHLCTLIAIVIPASYINLCEYLSSRS
jgi:hypothetical protein